jgi:hypothetical protein
MSTRDAAQGCIVFLNGNFPKNVQTICQNDNPFTLANGTRRLEGAVSAAPSMRSFSPFFMSCSDVCSIR